MIRYATQEEWDQSPEAMLIAGEEERLEGVDRAAVLVAFAALPVRLREVGTLRWIDGKSRKETAALLNMTPAAVRAAEDKAREAVIDSFAGRAP